MIKTSRLSSFSPQWLPLNDSTGRISHSNLKSGLDHLQRKRAARWRPLFFSFVSRRSAVHAVLQRFGDGHFDNLVGLFGECLTCGRVANLTLGALAAIDLANAR